jgi:hypothetical protein
VIRVQDESIFFSSKIARIDSPLLPRSSSQTLPTAIFFQKKKNLSTAASVSVADLFIRAEEE